MRRTSGMPAGADVRERLRSAQRAEAEAIAAVQKALAAEADARARLDKVIHRNQAEVSKAAGVVKAAQASLVVSKVRISWRCERESGTACARMP